MSKLPEPWLLGNRKCVRSLGKDAGVKGLGHTLTPEGGVGVIVGVAASVPVLDGVKVGVGVGDPEAVGVGVFVGVAVGMGVDVRVGIGVKLGVLIQTLSNTAVAGWLLLLLPLQTINP